jgi:hypothetical protein
MSTPTTHLCDKCATPLVVEIEPDSDSESNNNGPSTVPDDVRLSCGHHFHWECLLDAYALGTCSRCHTDITTTTSTTAGSSSAAPAPSNLHTQHIFVDLHNEGGLQTQIDIFPLLQEESYIRCYPDERKCRAFLEFCREGDHRAIVDVLKSCGEADDDDDDDDDDDSDHGPGKTADEILRYQDPVGEMQSGLHAAVANGHREVAWLLLLLASAVPELEFPALVYQEAATLGIMREDQTGKIDIRCLKDVHGRTAEDIARGAGVVWHGWVGNGRLAMP